MARLIAWFVVSAHGNVESDTLLQSLKVSKNENSAPVLYSHVGGYANDAHAGADSMLQGYRPEGGIQDEFHQLSADDQGFDDGLSFFVYGAGDERANGIYKGISEPFYNGSHFIGRYTFGAGWCCPDNAVVWWIAYGGHGRYFSCQKPNSEIPPTEGWQVRPQSDWDWSNTYMPLSLPNIAERILIVSGAGDETVNGDFFDIDGEVKNDVVLIKKESFGAGRANFCPNNNLVWWIGYAGHGRYFSCMAQEGTLPPMNGWTTRKTSLQAPVLNYKMYDVAQGQCAQAACPSRCNCLELVCSDSLKACMADPTCAPGRECVDACGCGDVKCLSACVARGTLNAELLGCFTVNCQ